MFRNHPDVIGTTKPSWNVRQWGVVRLGQSGAHLLYLKNSNSNFKKYCTTSSVMHFKKSLKIIYTYKPTKYICGSQSVDL